MIYLFARWGVRCFKVSWLVRWLCTGCLFSIQVKYAGGVHSTREGAAANTQRFYTDHEDGTGTTIFTHWHVLAWFLCACLKLLLKGKVWVLTDSTTYIGRLKTSSALQSRKWQWLAWANDITMHCVAIHCQRQQTVGPTVQHNRYTTTPISHTRPSPISRTLLLISRPAEGRRLSWPAATAWWDYGNDLNEVSCCMVISMIWVPR